MYMYMCAWNWYGPLSRGGHFESQESKKLVVFARLASHWMGG